MDMILPMPSALALCCIPSHFKTKQGQNRSMDDYEITNIFLGATTKKSAND